ncbi:uncharacterized protein LOC123219374 isoform X3 [Mangifera indica]|uniref:uncharacterized protein LOC123219374 isoform X3 n=1 Tax=Mangifera indica TaxID=29780 RepID=UPI001CFAE19B|nr:uncharacterized protein LOC123219374 isoform X3 [Mangifera indica]
MLSFSSRPLLLFRIDRLLRLKRTYLKPTPVDYLQGRCFYYNLSCNWKMDRTKEKSDVVYTVKKPKNNYLVWRPVSSQASFAEECSVNQVKVGSDDVSQTQEVTVGSEDIRQIQEVQCSTSSDVSDAQHVVKVEAVTEVTDSTLSSHTLSDDVEVRASIRHSEISAEKHSLSLEVVIGLSIIGASVIRFVKGREGSMQKKIEEEMGVKIIIPSSRKEDSIIIEGISLDSINKASERIQSIVNEAVNSPSLEYSHFISLPLAIHPELVDKLVNFQKSVLGIGDAHLDENADCDSSKDTSDNGDRDRKLNKRPSVVGDDNELVQVDVKSIDEKPDVAVECKVGDDNKHVEVDIKSIPLVSYTPKAAKSSFVSADLGIDKSIFIKPKTFHLTVLMLKLWNKDRVNAATEVLKSISSKVKDALDNRPIFVRLKGLDCMRGSLAKARVVYAPVEEIGDDGRLLRACQVIIDAFNEAGLVLEKDAKQKLKLHATVMNARHQKRKSGTRKLDSFDARDIFKQYGSEEWGEYIIREAHLSQRFLFDESGYYHCCASVPFPEDMKAN